MPELAMAKYGCAKEETAVIGDRIYTDVKSGLNAGAMGILVLSGESTLETLAQSDVKPDLVLESCGEILEILRQM
jgi:ribonucleotide monophosphatase NagD (HAD superfamily)